MNQSSGYRVTVSEMVHGTYMHYVHMMKFSYLKMMSRSPCFTFPSSPFPLACSIKVGVYGFTVIFQLSLHGPNNISWYNIEQNKYIDKLGNHKSISFILKQHLSYDN